MKANLRDMRLISPIVSIVISTGLLVYGMTRSQQEAYSFPDLFLAAMIVCSILWFIGIATEKRESSSVRSWPAFAHWREVGGGVVLTLIYLMVARWMGFLLSSLLLFFILGVAYSPKGKSFKSVLIVATSAVAFMAVIYVLFNVLLQVQTPGGIL